MATTVATDSERNVLGGVCHLYLSTAQQQAAATTAPVEYLWAERAPLATGDDAPDR